jgi:anti-sigma regulatory factor (Ser/Thr protein kinase)
MPYGQQHAPVRPGSRRLGQRPMPTGPPDRIMPDALLPAARWVCDQITSSPLDAGLASRAAREFTGQLLRGWDLLALAEDAAVIVSELVTNALRHGVRDLSGVAAAHVELIWWLRAAEITCMVTDPGAAPPVMAPPDPLAETGRGLHVVDALSGTWGWTWLGGCRKAVWATLPVPTGCGRPA